MVTISGRGLSGVYSVNLDAAPVTVLSVSDTAVRVQINNWNQTGWCTLHVPGGLSVRGDDVFTVGAAAPIISGFSPASGPPGSAVRLVGSGFTGASVVTLAGAPVIVTSVTDTAIDVRLNSWNSSGSFTVGLPGGASASSHVFTVR